MEEKVLLKKYGNMVLKIRDEELNLSQKKFYEFLYPGADLPEDSIKKKIHKIEAADLEFIDPEFLLQLHDKLELSFDYLFGYEKDYPNYEIKAACDYTGLSVEAIEQLHYWNECRKRGTPDMPDPEKGTLEELNKISDEVSKFKEAEWILEIVNKLFERENKSGKVSKIADLSVLYDLYMMAQDTPDEVLGIPSEIAYSDINYMQKVYGVVRVASDTLSYKDQMGEIHNINVGVFNKQIFRDRLLRDVEEFIKRIRGENTEEPKRKKRPYKKRK